MLELLNEQQQFIHMLHHDNHNSYISRFQSKAEKQQYSTNNLAEIESYDYSYNTYISLNGFSKYGRRSEDVRELTCIYYDLDMHGTKNQGYIDECVENTIRVLWDAFFYDEVLPEPTMITKTGRGIGLFYVLERSIACAKGKNAGQVEFWKTIYRRLGKKIQSIIVPANNTVADDPEALLELDEKVLCDVSRVTRLPLTINKSANQICKMESVAYDNGKPKYYNLKELSSYVFSKVYSGTRDVKEQNKLKKETSLIQYDFYMRAFLEERVKVLEKLQKFRKGEGRNCRDYLCFTYYNHAKQLYGSAEGERLLQEYNSQFIEPLPEREIKNVIKGVERNSGDTYEGFYKLSNEWIVRHCDVSVLERDVLDFDVSRKKIKRKMQHQEIVRNRNEERAAIVEEILQHPEETYTEVAQKYHVSLRKIQMIVNAEGIQRRGCRRPQKAIENEERRNAPVMSEIRNMGKLERPKEPQKIPAVYAKICPIVCCVTERPEKEGHDLNEREWENLDGTGG